MSQMKLMVASANHWSLFKDFFAHLTWVNFFPSGKQFLGIILNYFSFFSPEQKNRKERKQPMGRLSCLG